DEPLVADLDRLPGTALPAERTGEYAVTQVQYPLITQQPTSVQLHAFLTNDRDKRQPIRGVRQLRPDDGGVVEDSMNQGGRQVPQEAFLEGPPRREIAIPNGENRLLLVDCGPPKFGLAYVPIRVHPMLSSRMCG